ncbi:helix-turn-helix domain-containing protein [Aeromonas caviae]|uniref:helix-turn-helix domain-containing protein n=1 Tax=Aeromonas caviae TaxID=648 RepID=UPI003F747167
MTEAIRYVKAGCHAKKCILLQLAAYGNDETGVCWPSLGTLVEVCEMGRSTLIRHLGALIEAGLVVKEERHGDKGQESNVYRLAAYSPKSQIGTGEGSQFRTPPVPTQDPPSPKSGPKSVTESGIESVNTHKGACASSANQDSTPRHDVRQKQAEALAHLKEITELDGSKGEARQNLGKLLDPVNGLGHSVEEVVLVAKWAKATWTDGLARPPAITNPAKFADHLESARAWKRPTQAPAEPIDWSQYA